MKIGNISHSSNQRSNTFQQKTCSKNPGFGSLSAPVLLAAGALAVAPLIWIDNQKWSGQTFDQLKKQDEMKAALSLGEDNSNKFVKFIAKLLKRTSTVA
jgi:hypothetical protein